jgi:hypothetical protein
VATAKESITRIVNTLLAENEVAPILSAAQQSFLRDNILLFTEQSRNGNNKFGWETFVSAETGDPDALVSKITTGGKNYNALLNMTTLEKAQLVPKINLFKVLFDGTDRSKIKEIPIPFPDSSKENIEALISSRGQRGDDVAIKSFTFDFKNQNPFGAGRIVDCQLVLTMINGESLTKKRLVKRIDKESELPETFTFADLIIRNNRKTPVISEKFDSDYYEIKANVGWQIPAGSGISSELKDDLRNMQVPMMLMLLDYDISFQQNGMIELTLSYRARIEQLLEKPIKYNIFKETEVSLDPTIRPRLEKLQADLIDINNEERFLKNYESVKGLEPKILRDLTEEEKAAAPIQNLPSSAWVNTVLAQPVDTLTLSQATAQQYQASFGAKETAEEATIRALNDLPKTIDALKVRKQEIQNQYNQLNNQTLFMAAKNRIQKFNQLVTNMFKNGKVNRIAIDKRNLLIYGSSFRDSLQKEREAVLGFREEIPVVGFLDPFSAEKEAIEQEVEANLLDQLKGGQGSAKDFKLNLDVQVDIAAQEIGKEANLSQRDISAQVNPTLAGLADPQSAGAGQKVIYWFYYGDLLEEAFKMNDVHLRMKEDHIIPILSGFELKDPNSPQIKKQVNIADIPISMEMFLEFFKINIIDSGRDNYPALDFIRDTTQRLVMPALNVETFGNPQKEPKIIKVSSFDLPGKKAGKIYKEPLFETYKQKVKQESKGDPLTSAQININLKEVSGAVGARINFDSSLFGKGTVFGKNALLATRRTSQKYSYVIFYATATNEALGWAGDIEEDSKRGVYHYYVGSDRGLIKQINFRKSQRPGLAEMMAERALRGGDRNVELWRNFEVDITMIGNALLKPGCFLYINPTVAGLGNPNKIDSLSRQMGLGGYYFVLGVSNNISETGWNTQVRAVWQSAPSIR